MRRHSGVDAGPLLVDIGLAFRVGLIVSAMKVTLPNSAATRARRIGTFFRSDESFAASHQEESLKVGDQTARGPIFPATCARCGGRVSGPVSFCPHCGAQSRLAFGDRAPTTKSGVAPAGAADARATGPRDAPRWPLRPRPSFASADSDPYGDVGVTSSAGARSWRVKTAATVALLAAVALCGAVLLLHWHDDSDTREQRVTSSTVQGTVMSNDINRPNPATAHVPTTAQRPEAAQGSSPPQGSITAQRPTVTTTVPSTAASNATASPLSQRPSQSSSDAQNEVAPSPNSMANDKGYGDKRQRLMSLALARAHSGLENNDLHTARSGIYWALSLQSDNREAFTLKQDLLSRQAARDAALKAARSCVGQERRQCVWHNASNALSIDSSSAEAKALVESSKAAKPTGLAPVQSDVPLRQ